VSDVQVISGTRRAMKEMADGTLRVQIDIDPKFRSAFFAAFGQIDMPVAIAPLVADFEQRALEAEKTEDGYGQHYAVLYKSGWFHNPKVVAAFEVDMEWSSAERIEAIKQIIYEAFGVESLTDLAPVRFIPWCQDLGILATLPAAFGAA
jgi:hypothetical protein